MHLQPPPSTDVTPAPLIEAQRLIEAVGPILDWYEWYAAPDRPTDVTAADYERFLAAAGQLEPITRLFGPVGDAAHVLVVGGYGYTTAQILSALDLLDALVRPGRSDRPSWRSNPSPALDAAGRTTAAADAPPPERSWTEVPLPGF